MLEEILRYIEKTGVISKTQISRDLSMPLNLVELGFTELTRMGFLEKDQPQSCSPSLCGGCPFAKSCHKDLVSSYSITEKGQKLINN